MSRSRAFLFCCLSFITGILISSAMVIPPVFFLGILILGIFFSSVFWPHKKLAIIGFCVLFLVLGIWRHQQVWSNIPQIQEQNISLIGFVAAEPDIRETHIKLILKEVKPHSIRGKILATAGRYPEYQYGDKLEITGKLETPREFDDFDYKGYLAKDGIYSVMYYPEIKRLGENEGGLTSFIYGKILWLKGELRRSIYGNLSPPQSSILGAMILGDKGRMSDELKENLNITGLRHITAISGMHVTIISLILMQFLLGIGLWRGQAFYITLLLLALFIIMVGLPSSAVRAGIMAGAFLLARHLGRPSSALGMVIFAAAVMLALNPMLAALDVGFQLSFLAVLGIVLLGPHLKWRMKKVPEQKFINLRSILAMTFSAQIFTFPILIYNFGQVSLLSPLSNALVLPLLPPVLAIGFAAAFLGVFWGALGQLASLPVWFFLTYIAKLVELFPLIPGGLMEFGSVSWIWPAAGFLFIAIATFLIRQFDKNRDSPDFLFP